MRRVKHPLLLSTQAHLNGAQAYRGLNRRQVLKLLAATTTASAVLPLQMSCTTSALRPDSGQKNAAGAQSSGQNGDQHGDQYVDQYVDQYIDEIDIAILGGGLAGLSSAYFLHQNGLRAHVFEQSARLGGRVLSLDNLFFEGFNGELGGEVFASDQEDALELLRALELPLIEVEYAQPIFHRPGKQLSESEFLKGLQSTINKISIDVEQIKRGDQAHLKRLDHTSLATYLKLIEVGNPQGEMLVAAFECEYGVSAEKLSSLCLVLLGPFADENPPIAPHAQDKGYMVAQGNSTLVKALAKPIPEQINLEHQIKSVSRWHDERILLEFQTEDANKRPTKRLVAAHQVIVAVPAPALAQIRFNDFTERYPIADWSELTYGTITRLLNSYEQFLPGPSSKMFFGGQTAPRLWLANQVKAKNLTVTAQQAGSHLSQAWSQLPLHEQAVLNADKFETYFGLLATKRSKNSAKYDWQPGKNNSFGARPAPVVGRYAWLQALQSTKAGPLYFAGDYLGASYTGTMNGAIRSAKAAALAVIAALKTV